MSTFSDALAALKNVVLMQERLQVVQRDVDELASRVDGLGDYSVSLDKRLVRIETMVEMTRGSGQPRIEG